MPFAGVPESQTGALDSCVDKVMGKGHDKSSAIAICRASMNLSDTPVIRWVEKFEYKAGQPFRIMPVGKFKRGERELDITKERLQQMADNHANGRPRWDIPIYQGHPTTENPDPPKIGNARKLEVRDDGLYAVPEWSDTGQKVVADEAYQYNSPGVLWSLNGSKYSDDKGNEFDNVIDHIALTNKPFFGKNTALFSDNAIVLAEADKFFDKQKHTLATIRGMVAKLFDALKEAAPEEVAVPEVTPPTPPVVTAETAGANITTTADAFRSFTAEQRREMADKGMAMPDGSYPIENKGDLQNAIHAVGRGDAPHAQIKRHIMKRAKAMGAEDMLPADWMHDQMSSTSSSAGAGDARAKAIGKEKKMSDETTQETFAVTAEEFAALKAKAERAAELEAKFAEQQKQVETLALNYAAEKKARRLGELSVAVEKFTIDHTDMAEKFYALEEKDPTLAQWVLEKFNAYESLGLQAALFSQRGHTAPVKQGAETFDTAVEKVLKDKFDGDRKKYAEAMAEVSKARPDLADAYLRRAPAAQAEGE